MTVEETIKAQYAFIFKSDRAHWFPFKQAADFYFKNAALLKKKHIKSSDELRLWFRNVQKRLFIGIATELLLKAIYLKNGFNINKPKRGKNVQFPELINNLNEDDLNAADTYTLADLINNLDKVLAFINDITRIKEGLNICKVFRNKEGHVAVHWHKFESENYSQIEYSIIELYKLGLNEKLDFSISMKGTQDGKFEIK